MNDKNIYAIYDKYILNTYKRVGPVFVRGKGSFLWDDQGSRYLDLFPGWGVSILGHCHPKIAAVIAQQAKKLIHLPNNLYQEAQILLAREIVKNSFDAKVFFANSGAEAIEGALKLSRLYGQKSGRYEIIAMRNSFHGRTFGALSATGQEKYNENFKPLLPEFRHVAFNNFEALQNAANSKTVGVLLELIQGEGGVNVAGKDYVLKLRDYCKKNDLLLIIDEVQTGMGRTGKMFAYQNYGITPDIMVLSKGLGAGVPISALIAHKRIADLFKPGMHASTFGGSPLVCAAGLAVFKIIEQEKILKHVKEMGLYLQKQLRALQSKFSFIKEVRGAGLMVGLELAIDSYPIFKECLERKLIINSTHDTILRIMPALNVSRDELNKGLAILKSVFSDMQNRNGIK
ncbi:MAG: aspartate aminotransferase family protein [Candidatus Omnitrophica bacterium]|nr:aspartate aminotransferase family protein [Candidatus Omnitrophota bacterium]